MAEENQYIYDDVADYKEQRRNEERDKIYTLPLATLKSEANEYQLPIASTSQLTNKERSSWISNTESKVNAKYGTSITKKSLAALILFMILVFVLSTIAITISVLSWQGIQFNTSGMSSSDSLLATQLDATNMTSLLQQISILDTKLEIQMNLTQMLNARLEELTSTFETLEHDIHLRNNATKISQTATTNNLEMLETRVDQWLSNPYQNCIKETATCPISQLINDNRRLLCTTGSLAVNRTVSIE